MLSRLRKHELHTQIFCDNTLTWIVSSLHRLRNTRMVIQNFPRTAAKTPAILFSVLLLVSTDAFSAISSLSYTCGQFIKSLHTLFLSLLWLQNWYLHGNFHYQGQYGHTLHTSLRSIVVNIRSELAHQTAYTTGVKVEFCQTVSLSVLQCPNIFWHNLYKHLNLSTHIR